MAPRPTAPFEELLVVDGQRIEGAGWIERRDPARPDELAGRAAAADATIAERAVNAARRAQGDWAARPVEERTTLLRRAADAVARDVDAPATMLCREVGKVLGDCVGEVSFSLAYLRDACTRTERLLGEVHEVDDEQGRMVVAREPHGVVGAVTPWNAPVILAMLKVAPALATGNTLVLKPSPVAPLAVTNVLATIAEHLPAGVLQVVNGGADVGRVVTGHHHVDKVAFTGGLETGRAIMRNAAETVKPLVLELGGNDAAVFLDDAVLDDAAIERAVLATFITSGQVCMAAKRLLVHRSRIDEFVERYLEVASRVLVTGDPFDTSVNVGPLALPDAASRVEALVDDARRAGAIVHDLGVVQDEQLVERGWFVRPTLVTGATPDLAVVEQEQFGPTVPVLAFDDEDGAVALANATPFGLGSSVWSADEDRAFALARRLRTGFTFVNTHNRTGMSMRAPFGGRGLSGFGREYGEAGIAEYLVTHTINAPAAFRHGGSGAASAYPGTDA